MRLDGAEAETAVEVGTADMDAVVGQHVGGPVGASPALGAEAHQREVGGAAADVGDQRQFLAVEAAFVVEAGGDRFVLERYLVETELAGDLGQRRLGDAIGFGIAVDE